MARLLLLGTGGTIAASAAEPLQLTGYEVQNSIQDMLAALPGAHAIAQIRCQQLFNLDSRALGASHMLRLARCLEKELARPDTDGIVVTHGTDTLEETAFMLQLLLTSSKPVVLVGAMRPASAPSADGPLNLLNALRVAADPASHGRGVLVLMNDCILAARYASKGHTLRPDAFGERGLLGQVAAGQVRYQLRVELPTELLPVAKLRGLRSLPAVDIIYDHQDAGGHFYRAAIDNGSRGLVIAALGNGSLSPAAERGCTAALRAGLVVVRASRVAQGAVSSQAADGATMLAAHMLAAPQARILLRLALAAELSHAKIAALLQRL